MKTLRHLWHLFLRDFWKTAASSQFRTPDKARYFEGLGERNEARTRPLGRILLAAYLALIMAAMYWYFPLGPGL